jgi:hypothetical protein
MLLAGDVPNHHGIILGQSCRDLKSDLSGAHRRPRIAAVNDIGAMAPHRSGVGLCEGNAEIGCQQNDTLFELPAR